MISPSRVFEQPHLYSLPLSTQHPQWREASRNLNSRRDCGGNRWPGLGQGNPIAQSSPSSHAQPVLQRMMDYHPPNQGSHLEGPMIVHLTWIMIPLSLYSTFRALENVYTKACSGRENTSGPGACLIVSPLIVRFPRVSQVPAAWKKKEGTRATRHSPWKLSTDCTEARDEGILQKKYSG